MQHSATFLRITRWTRLTILSYHPRFWILGQDDQNLGNRMAERMQHVICSNISICYIETLPVFSRTLRSGLDSSCCSVALHFAWHRPLKSFPQVKKVSWINIRLIIIMMMMMMMMMMIIAIIIIIIVIIMNWTKAHYFTDSFIFLNPLHSIFSWVQSKLTSYF